MRIVIVTNRSDSASFQQSRTRVAELFPETRKTTYEELERELKDLKKPRPQLVVLSVPRHELGVPEQQLVDRLINHDPPVIYQAKAVSGAWGIPTVVCVDTDEPLPIPGERADPLALYCRLAQLTDYVDEAVTLARVGLIPSEFRIEPLASSIARSRGCDFAPPDQLTDANRLILHHEFPRQPGAQIHFVLASCEALGPDNASVSAALALARTCLKLATLNVEGKTYQLSCVLSGDEPTSPWILRFAGELNLLHLAEDVDALKAIAEVAQGRHVAVWVSSPSLRALGVVAFPRGSDQSPTIGSRRRLLVFDLPGDRTVQIHGSYGSDCVPVRFRHDGFRWQVFPPTALCDRLSNFLQGEHKHKIWGCFLGAFDLAIHRGLGTLVCLGVSHEELSEIPKLRSYVEEPLLSPIQLSPESLLSLLRVDGAHFFDRAGEWTGFARHVPVRAAGSASGAGSSAAQELAKMFPTALTIKLSAGGSVRIYPKEPELGIP